MDICSNAVRKVLSNLDEDKVVTVAKHLTEDMGVEGLGDLKMVEEKDLVKVLKPIQARKLVQAWNDAEVQVMGNTEYSASASDYVDDSSSCYSPDSSPVCSPLSSSWSNGFIIPWGKMPPGLISSCSKKLKPTPKLRKEMVRNIMDAILQRSSRPCIKDLRNIARQMVEKYPESLGDNFGGTTYGVGYASLANQMWNRLENVRRRKRQLGFTGNDRETMKVKPKSYGVIDLGSGEENNIEVLEGQMHFLQEEAKKTNPDSKTVMEAMDITFSAQRKMIDSNPPIQKVKQEWPFLFKKEVLFSHYCKLTGNDADFIGNLSAKVPVIYSSLKDCSHRGMSEVIEKIKAECRELENDSPKVLRFLDMLSCYFKEDLSAIYVVEQTDTPIEKMPESKLGSAPIMVVRGTSVVESKLIEIVIERTKVYQTLCFLEALAYLYWSYFVLNMEYPKEALVTYEFLQRYLANLDEPGTRGRKSRRYSVHPKVLTLIRFISQKSEE